MYGWVMTPSVVLMDYVWKRINIQFVDMSAIIQPTYVALELLYG